MLQKRIFAKCQMRHVIELDPFIEPPTVQGPMIMMQQPLQPGDCIFTTRPFLFLLSLSLNCLFYSIFFKFPLQINWFDHTNAPIEDTDYHSQAMVTPNDRLFEARSTAHFIPR